MSLVENRYLHWFFIVAILWLVLVYDSIVGAASVWYVNDTFNHCFFVIPIAVYLALQEKNNWLVEKPTFSWLGACYLLLCSFIWLFAYAGRIDSLMHLAAFSGLSLVWITLTGWSVAKKLWFPLLFVLFAVPIGEELIPLFQDVTATISVKLLNWSGVAVFREGLFIQIPEGRFLVAEACSGVRFFISTVMLGALCSFLLFQTIYKRILFMVFAIVMPIVANIFRAYGTMMVGHVFGMEHAAGADHLIYGWFFFALVTVILILVGHLFKEEIDVTVGNISKDEIHQDWQPFRVSIPVLILSAMLIIMLGWKLLISEENLQDYSINLEGFTESVKIKSDQSNWESSFPEASEYVSKLIPFKGKTIEHHIHAYINAGRKAELIAWKNRIYDPDEWTLESQENIRLEEKHALHQYIVSNRGHHRSVVFWYSVPGYEGVSRVRTKLHQALNVMLGRGNDGFVYILSVSGRDFSHNSELLKDYIRENNLALSSISNW